MMVFVFVFFCFFLLRPVGMPKMEKVYLHNPSSEEISLISISATTAHFHASFFQSRVSNMLGLCSLKMCLSHNSEDLMQGLWANGLTLTSYLKLKMGTDERTQTYVCFLFSSPTQWLCLSRDNSMWCCVDIIATHTHTHSCF